MSAQPEPGDPGRPAWERNKVQSDLRDLWSLYDTALPRVYGYLIRRTGERAVAEDLTSETFLGAIGSIRCGSVAEVTEAWLMRIARNKLIDHWRRTARSDALRARAEAAYQPLDDPWDAHIDRTRAHEVLAILSVDHRAALTLRYLDGLPVAEIAVVVDRTVHATEALLVRARTAFRRRYEETEGTPP